MSEKSSEDVTLAGLVAALDEQGSLDVVRQRAASGENVLTIIQDCQSGMQYVGDHYQSGKYYISGLIMAGEIFREAMEILAPLMPEPGSENDKGTVLLCTVRGDIHDLGKDIVDMLLRSYGFTVHDLGVDVAPADVAACARELQPDIVGLSGLLTGAAVGMKQTVAALRTVGRELGRPLPVIIGGGMVDEALRKSTGADLYADDAARGVQLIREAIAAARG